MANDPILNAALKTVIDSNAQIDEAHKILKVLQDAGVDVSSERASLESAVSQRNKIELSLRSNGATVD